MNEDETIGFITGVVSVITFVLLVKLTEALLALHY